MTSQKPHWRFSQTKYHRWEVLLSQPPIKKNDYRSVIETVFHIVVIWISNKSNDRW